MSHVPLGFRSPRDAQIHEEAKGLRVIGVGYGPDGYPTVVLEDGSSLVFSSHEEVGITLDPRPASTTIRSG